MDRETNNIFDVYANRTVTGNKNSFSFADVILYEYAPETNETLHGGGELDIFDMLEDPKYNFQLCIDKYPEHYMDPPKPSFKMQDILDREPVKRTNELDLQFFTNYFILDSTIDGDMTKRPPIRSKAFERVAWDSDVHVYACDRQTPEKLLIDKNEKYKNILAALQAGVDQYGEQLGISSYRDMNEVIDDDFRLNQRLKDDINLSFEIVDHYVDLLHDINQNYHAEEED
jgi:hypothetical protein